MELEYLLDSRNLKDQYIQYMTSPMVLPTGNPNQVCDDKYFGIQSIQIKRCTDAIYSVYCYSHIKHFHDFKPVFSCP